MTTQTETINIVIREDGSRVVRRNFDEVGGAASNAANKGVALLKRAISGLVAGVAINQIRQLVDSYTQMQNRLKLTTQSQGNLNAVFAELQAISGRTRSALEANTDLYSRMAIATKDLGTSQKEILQFTESLNKAIKISGATASESEAGLRQLSQGLASGALRGDELISVLENLPAVADVIAKSLGVTRGQLRAMGAEGKITADVVLKAFADARVELDEKFGKVAPTLAEGFVVLKNELIVTVGQLYEASGASSVLGSAFVSVGEFIKRITPELVNFVRALTGALDPMDELSDAGKVFATIFLTIGSVLSTVAKIIYTVVIGAFNAVGRSIGAMAAAVAAMLRGDFSEAGTIMKEGFVDNMTGLVDGTKDLYSTLVDDTSQTLEKMVKIWDKGARDIQDRSKLAVGQVSDQAGPNNTRTGPSEKDLAKQAKALDKLKSEYNSLLQSIAPLAGAQFELSEAEKTLDKAREAGIINGERHAQLLTLLKARYEGILNPLGALNRELDQEMGLLGMVASEREVEAQVLAASKQLLGEGVVLTERETEALRAKFEALQNLNVITEIQDQLLAGSVGQRQAQLDQMTAINNLLNDSASGFTQTDATAALAQSSPGLFENTTAMLELQVEQFRLMYEQIDLMRQEELISEETASQMRMNLWLLEQEQKLSYATSFFGQLSQLQSSENSKMAAIGKAAAIAQAVIQTYTGATAAFTSMAAIPFVGPFLGAAAAAAAIATGMANVARIRAQPVGFATGGNFMVGGNGGVDSETVAFRATPGERVQINTPAQARALARADKMQEEGSSRPTTVNQNLTMVLQGRPDRRTNDQLARAQRKAAQKEWDKSTSVKVT